MRILDKIKKNENSCGKVGQSGEKGCLQYLPTTWKGYSKQVIGYVAPENEANHWYVGAHKVNQWLKEGDSEERIAQKWNQGEKAGKNCIKGTNTRTGVKFDSCQYVAMFKKL